MQLALGGVPHQPGQWLNEGQRDQKDPGHRSANAQLVRT